MRKSRTTFASNYWQRYLRKRAQELATATTRATSDPLADWAVARIRLEGRPFRFEGHEYLKPIYDDTSPHVVLSHLTRRTGIGVAKRLLSAVLEPPDLQRITLLMDRPGRRRPSPADPSED